MPTLPSAIAELSSSLNIGILASEYITYYETLVSWRYVYETTHDVPPKIDNQANKWNLGYTSKSGLKNLDVELGGTYKWK